MNVPGKMCLIMSKDKSMVFIQRMSSTCQDINTILPQEDQGKEESDESDAQDAVASVGDYSNLI